MQLNLHTHLRILLALFAVSLITANLNAAKRPNILWIVGENFSNDLGCYGQDNVATPNLDDLAKKGVRYVNAFSTSPVCAPSRSCFMLGMYQTTTDTHHMRSHRDDDFKLLREFVLSRIDSKTLDTTPPTLPT